MTKWERGLKNMDAHRFPSKILLFGEYSVIKGAKALCISYPLFEGVLELKRNKNTPPDSELIAFSSYLKLLKKLKKLPTKIDICSLDFDISQGLFFNSTIPRGFGAGSSGALTASVFDRYGECSHLNILELKNVFSVLESHFHGSSSGLDPLVSYLKKNLLVNGNKNLSIVDIPDPKEGNGAIFLLNTRRPRRTEPLVNLFLEKYQSHNFGRRCLTELFPATNACIASFLSLDKDSLWKNFKILSQFQYVHLTQMIPPLFKELWKKGLENHDYYLKLCGAGGGGFLLGLTKNFEKLSSILKDCEIKPIVKV